MSSRLHGRNADRFIQERPTKAQPTSFRQISAVIARLNLIRWKRRGT